MRPQTFQNGSPYTHRLEMFHLWKQTPVPHSLCEQNFLSYRDSHSFCQTIHSGSCPRVSRSSYYVTTSSHSPMPLLTPTTSLLPPDGLVHLSQGQPALSLECLQFSTPHPQRHASLVLPLFTTFNVRKQEDIPIQGSSTHPPLL